MYNRVIQGGFCYFSAIGFNTSPHEEVKKHPFSTKINYLSFTRLHEKARTVFKYHFKSSYHNAVSAAEGNKVLE